MRTWLGRGKPLQIGITICCLVAFILYGYEQGVFGPIILNENWLEQFNHPGDSETGIIVSCYNLGCLLGCFIAFFIGETLGRRRMIWVAMGVVVTGTALQASSFTVPHLIIGRVLTGTGTGLKTSTVPMYQSELCPPTSRGRLVSAEVCFVGIGIIIAYWFDFAMSFVSGPIAWRLPVAMQAVFAIGVIFLVFALPESPRWLCKHGREQEAIDVLCAVYDKQPDDDFIVAERTAIAEAIELEGMEFSQNKSFFSIFRKDKVRTRYRIFLAWFIQFMNQATGVNMVVYYAPTLLVQSVGMTTQMSQIIAGCINIMFALGSAIPSFFLDRMGRRKTMMGGCAGMFVCMLFISALLSQSDGGATQRGTNFASGSVAFFFVYLFIFGLTVNCVPWVIVPEILPLQARTRGVAIGVSSNWLMNFTVVMISPIIINRLAWKAYLIFMATNFIFVPIVYFLYPETGNLRLEDVDHIFSDGRNPVVVAREMDKRFRAGQNVRGDEELGSSEESKSKTEEESKTVDTVERAG